MDKLALYVCAIWYTVIFIKQGKSEGFDSCDRPSNLTRIEFKSSIFRPVLPWNLMDDLEKQQATSSILHRALSIISKPSVNSNWRYSPETLNSGQIRHFICPVWPWNSMDDLENNRASLLCYFKLCAPFCSHRWIQTGVTFRKRPIQVKIGYFLSRATFGNLTDDLEKQKGTSPNLLLATFQSHWWIQTGVTIRKRPIWVKIGGILSRVTLTFDEWPWKTTGHLFYATSSFVFHSVAIGKFKPR